LYFRWGIKILSAEEVKGTGVIWANLFSRIEPADPMVSSKIRILQTAFLVFYFFQMMGLVWVMFFVSMIVFGTITWYIDNIKPGKYGVAKRWYFPVQVKKILDLDISELTNLKNFP